MTELEEILKLHFKLTPEMQPQDVVKLMYQRNFGPEHMILDPKNSLRMLEEECKDFSISKEIPLSTPIGNAFVRLNLQQAIQQYSLAEINDMFVRSAGVVHGSMSEFLADIKWVLNHLDLFQCDFTKEQFQEYLSWYRSQAYPSVHHSAIYRQKYDPHYRVVFNPQLLLKVPLYPLFSWKVLFYDNSVGVCAAVLHKGG